MTTHLTDPEAVVDGILASVGKRIVLAMPLGLGKANHIANALYRRAARDSSMQLHIFTALTLEAPSGKSELERRFIGPFAERLFKDYPQLDYVAAVRRNALPPNIQVNEFFFQAGRWLGNPTAQRSYIAANYTHAIEYVLARGVNVVAQLVAKKGDRYSLSCNPDLTLDLLEARRTGRANFIL